MGSPPKILATTFNEDFTPDRVTLEMDASDLAVLTKLVGRMSESSGGIHYSHYAALSNFFCAFYDEGVPGA